MKKELIRIKKALFLMKEDLQYNDKNSTKEKLILDTLKPIINSNSIWKNSAAKIMRDYYLISNQKTKLKNLKNYYLILINEKINFSNCNNLTFKFMLI